MGAAQEQKRKYCPGNRVVFARLSRGTKHLEQDYIYLAQTVSDHYQYRLDKYDRAKLGGGIPYKIRRTIEGETLEKCLEHC